MFLWLWRIALILLFSRFYCKTLSNNFAWHGSISCCIICQPKVGEFRPCWVINTGSYIHMWAIPAYPAQATQRLVHDTDWYGTRARVWNCFIACNKVATQHSLRIQVMTFQLQLHFKLLVDKNVSKLMVHSEPKGHRLSRKNFEQG